MLTRTPRPDFEAITTGELLALPGEHQAAYWTWLLNKWSDNAWVHQQADHQADHATARHEDDWSRS